MTHCLFLSVGCFPLNPVASLINQSTHIFHHVIFGCQSIFWASYFHAREDFSLVAFHHGHENGIILGNFECKQTPRCVAVHLMLAHFTRRRLSNLIFLHIFTALSGFSRKILPNGIVQSLMCELLCMNMLNDWFSFYEVKTASWP